MKKHNAMQLVGAIIETVFAIPVLGAALIIGALWIPLGIALIVHIIALVFTIQAKSSKVGPILGIIASTVGLIPFVGWILHILAAIFNYSGAFKK
jgi:hypothetical protein